MGGPKAQVKLLKKGSDFNLIGPVGARRLTHLIPGSSAHEIPGHTRGLGRQIFLQEIELSRTQIGLPPNLEYLRLHYRISSWLEKLLW
jgi:hypothetical protein